MPILTSAINKFKGLFENITRLLNPQKALLNDFKATKKELDKMNSSTEKLSGNDLKLFNLRKKLLEQDYARLEKEIAVAINEAKQSIVEEQKEFSKLVDNRNKLTTILENQTAKWKENNSAVKKSEKRALESTLAVDKQKAVILETTLALEKLKTEYQNILEPVVETNEVFTQSESTYEGFTLNTQKLAEATSSFNIEAEIAKLKTREMLETAKPSALGAMADGFKNIAMTVGLSFAQMALQGEKSIKQIINSLAKMIVQMSIALVIGTVLKSLFDPTATAMTAKNLAVAGGIIAGAGILSLATGGGGEPQGFAKGGIITKPVMGMIGEAGQSEAVIPLNRLPQMVGALSGNQRGEFTLRGQDLILALERAGDFRARITG